MEVAPHGFCTLGGDRIANAFTERIVQNSIYRNVRGAYRPLGDQAQRAQTPHDYR